MIRRIHQSEDVATLLRHTRAFRGGHIAELQVSRRHVFDEHSGSEILAGTTVVILIRYAVEARSAGRPERIQRLARLRCLGVTDFSFFEQEGTNSGTIEALQVEVHQGRFRFWFDQYGEIYVVCDEAELEEVSFPGSLPPRDARREWVFQAREGSLPTMEWFLEQLDQAGVPCVWRNLGPDPVRHDFEWAGVLSCSAVGGEARGGMIHVRGYGPLGGGAFGIAVRTGERDGGGDASLLSVLAGIVMRHFEGESIGSETAAPRS